MSVDVEVHAAHCMGTPQKATLEGLLIVRFFRYHLPRQPGGCLHTSTLIFNLTWTRNTKKLLHFGPSAQRQGPFVTLLARIFFLFFDEKCPCL